MSQIPICAIPGDGWNVKDYPLEYEGRLYHFNSEIDRWIFEQDPQRYRDHMTLVDRFLAGKIQPPDLMGALTYMSLAPGEMGDDAHGYAWVEAFRKPTAARRRVTASAAACSGAAPSSLPRSSRTPTMALFPIISNFERDFVLLLVPVDTENTMDEVAAAAAHHSVGRRVAPQPDKVIRVRRQGASEFFPRDKRVSTRPTSSRWRRSSSSSRTPDAMTLQASLHARRPLGRRHDGGRGRRPRRSCSSGPKAAKSAPSRACVRIRTFRLSEGKLDGRVSCAAPINGPSTPTTGAGVNPGDCRLAEYPVKIEGEAILVSVEGVAPTFAHT